MTAHSLSGTPAYTSRRSRHSQQQPASARPTSNTISVREQDALLLNKGLEIRHPQWGEEMELRAIDDSPYPSLSREGPSPQPRGRGKRRAVEGRDNSGAEELTPGSVGRRSRGKASVSRRHSEAEDEESRERQLNRRSGNHRLDEASDEVEAHQHSQAGKDADPIGKEGYRAHHGRSNGGRSPMKDCRSHRCASGERRGGRIPSTTSTSSSGVEEGEADRSRRSLDSVGGSKEG